MPLLWVLIKNWEDLFKQVDQKGLQRLDMEG